MPTDAEVEELFNLYDEDGSGCIDASELPTLLRYLGFAPTEKQCAELIKRHDKDGDSQLDLAEFKKLIRSETEKGEIPSVDIDALRRAFEVLDRDGSGKLSLKELRKALTTLGEPLSDAQVDALFREHASSGTDGDEEVGINVETFICMMSGVVGQQTVEQPGKSKGPTGIVGEFKSRALHPVATLSIDPSRGSAKPEELEAVRVAFAKYDVDKSGAIDARELTRLLADLGIVVSRTEAAEVLRRVDANGSGRIELDEMCRWYPSVVAWASENLGLRLDRAEETRHVVAETLRKISAVFRSMDKDGSGFLSQAEFCDAVAAVGGQPPADAAAFFAKFGVNGQVSEQNFLRLLAQLVNGSLANTLHCAASFASLTALLQKQGAQVKPPVKPVAATKVKATDDAVTTAKILIAAGDGDAFERLFSADMVDFLGGKDGVRYYGDIVRMNKSGKCSASKPDADGGVTFSFAIETPFFKETKQLQLYFAESGNEICGVDEPDAADVEVATSDAGVSYDLEFDLANAETFFERYFIDFQEEGKKATAHWLSWQGVNLTLDTFDMTVDPPTAAVGEVQRRSVGTTGNTKLWVDVIGPCRVKVEMRGSMAPRKVVRRPPGKAPKDGIDPPPSDDECGPVMAGADSAPFIKWLKKGKIDTYDASRESSLLFAYRVMAHLAKTIEYSATDEAYKHGTTLGTMIQYGKTDCGGHSNIFHAALRNVGLFARRVTMPAHVFCEVYVDGCGWVPIETTLKDISALEQCDNQGFLVHKGNDFIRFNISWAHVDTEWTQIPALVFEDRDNDGWDWTANEKWQFEDVKNAPGKIGVPPVVDFVESYKDGPPADDDEEDDTD